MDDLSALISKEERLVFEFPEEGDVESEEIGEYEERVWMRDKCLDRNGAPRLG